MVSSSALDTILVTSQQIWGQLWQSQQADVILVQCGRIVGSSALEKIGVGSVTSQQIWDQFWRSQRAVFILVQSEQMVGSSALD